LNPPYDPFNKDKGMGRVVTFHFQEFDEEGVMQYAKEFAELQDALDKLGRTTEEEIKKEKIWNRLNIVASAYKCMNRLDPNGQLSPNERYESPIRMQRRIGREESIKLHESSKEKYWKMLEDGKLDEIDF
jgi:hypothetical protein